jgi:endogenous inhibitor of DNA gyrase (YacG/DUF329 family)
MSARALCVHCRQREVEVRYRPFCSHRCQLADLGRWLNGDYRIAGGPVGAPNPDKVEPDDDARDDRDR